MTENTSGIVAGPDTPRTADALLRANEERYRSVFQAAALGIAVVDSLGRIVDANPALCHMFDLSPGALRGTGLRDLISEDDLPLVGPPLQRVLVGDTSQWSGDARSRSFGRGDAWMRVALTRTALEQDGRTLIIAMIEDITLRKRSDEALRLSATVFESTREAIAILDGNGRIGQANKAFCRMFGYGVSEVGGLGLADLADPSYETPFFIDIIDRLLHTGHWQGEIMGRRKSTSPPERIAHWLSLTLLRHPDGSVQNWIAVFTDLTERKQREEEVWRQANFDQVTGLPNRRLFHDRLNQALQIARRSAGRLAVFFIDLDGFKHVNDTLGHDAGDQLLREVALRLQARLRTTDLLTRNETLARIGGDEFTVILPDVADPEAAATVAERMISAMTTPFLVNGEDVYTTASIGIAIFPDHGSVVEELLRCADMALYRAKDEGRNRFHFFNSDMQVKVVARKSLELDLRKALDEKQFRLVYQPQIDARTGRVIGVEALLRWTHPKRGAVSPAEFVPIAEATGLIVDIGDWLTDEACRQTREWQRQGCTPLIVAVNLSVVQIRGSRFVDVVDASLARHGLDPHWLNVEITESLMMENAATAQAMFDALRARGIKIALDDFGTGYSSLSYLTKFPVEKIKIDRSFVSDIAVDRNNAAITQAVVKLGHSLGIRINIEGVETDEQVQILKSFGVDEFQGYFYSRPLEADAVAEFVRLRHEALV